jgi:hypothetical protein
VSRAKPFPTIDKALHHRNSSSVSSVSSMLERCCDHRIDARGVIAVWRKWSMISARTVA